MADNNTEELLEASLKQYREELSLVQTSLDCDQTNGDLIELRDKYIEIIALTEVELIGVKKARLLAELEAQTSGHNSDDVSNGDEPKPSTSDAKTCLSANEINIGNDLSLNESLSELNGKECRVPLSEANGSVRYHNAIIMTIDGDDDTPNATDISDTKVRVFFTYPLNNRMLSCPHYLSAKCRFAADKCRYSHGMEVLFKDIKPYEAIDYSTFGRDSVCLAKNKDDSLWHKAIVDDIRADQTIVVKYCDNDFIDTTSIEDIVPLSGDCLEETNDDQLNGNSLNDCYDDDMRVQVFKSSSAMAEWEVHTKGIGSKLMAKMGYVFGQGLGRNGEGITEPIVRKQKGWPFRDLFTVFDFINNKVFAKQSDNSSHSLTSGHSKPISTAELKASTAQSLNISSFKISEDIRKAESELRRLRDSMSRNKSRDPVMCNQLQQKVDKQLEVIAGLKRKESLIHREQSSSADNMCHKLHKGKAFVFPTGKSLDKCIELRDKYLTDDGVKARIKLKQKALQKRIIDGYTNVKRRENSVFDFINNKVFAKQSNNSSHPSTSGHSKPISTAELKASTPQSLNISSFKISEDIRKAESELRRLRDSMSRNKSRDPVMCNQLQQKVDKQLEVIAGLKRKESLIHREQSSRSNKHKLSVF
ncbi:unnamed protein product [Medioppia subpectinata]|uniref:Zinc finger CCCH-type with G patch domain-containing protein n=1 Tax=Medioppia subpectinata TaxID=1979941 RepID=A0A7R9KP43_9ACAR|nr:unnamed protein product [Medioppia subpectinata]CAG2107162.1 unnamed protein product [Medioppia subpectinata]